MSYPKTKQMNLEDGQTLLAAVDGKMSDLKSAIQQISDPAWGSKAAGIARKVISDQYATDNLPYNFRQAFDADWNEDKLIGGTVAWNQLVQNGNFADDSVWTRGSSWTIANGKASIDQNTKNFYSLFQAVNTVIGHKYLCCCTVDSFSGDPSFNRLSFTETFGNYPTTVVQINGNGRIGGIAEATASPMYLGIKTQLTETHISIKQNISNMVCIDLTQMFGSTIADAIYTMEQATAGSGVAWFRKLFPANYYAYDAGSLQSVQAANHKVVGFNQWDGNFITNKALDSTTGAVITAGNAFVSENYITVVRNTDYYIKGYNNETVMVWGYDRNGNAVKRLKYSGFNAVFNSSECDLIKFSTSAKAQPAEGDICINLSDPAKNGTYEPYKSATYPLGNVELRGIPKIDGNGNLYYEGDEYTANGTVTRRYGIVDLGTLTWEKGSTSFYATFGQGKYYGGCICPRYTNVNAGYQQMENNTITISNSIAFPVLRIRDDSLINGSADDFKTAMSGIYFVYELATPTTETTDPFEIAQDVFYDGTEEYVDRAVTAETPTRDVAIPVGHESKYYKDYRREMNAKLSASQKLMELIITSNREDGMKATKAYSQGNLMIVNGQLYKATTSIANGATLTVDTNIVSTTVAAELAALA